MLRRWGLWPLSCGTHEYTEKQGSSHNDPAWLLSVLCTGHHLSLPVLLSIFSRRARRNFSA
jgi:hypothetical protein